MNNKIAFAYLSILLLSNPARAATFSSASLSWSGPYVGGFVGGAAGTRVTTTEPFRLDNSTYWYRPFHDSFNYKTGSSLIGGMTLGYNWQMKSSPYLVGLESEYGYFSAKGSSADSNENAYAALLPGNNLMNTSRNAINIADSFGYVLISGRIGYVIERALLYAKSGVVYTRTKSTYNSIKTEDLVLVYLNMSGNKDIFGYGLGAGFEYAFSFLPNVSTKIEYLFLGINRSQYVYGDCTCDFLWRITEHINGVNTIKLGMNYAFG